MRVFYACTCTLCPYWVVAFAAGLKSPRHHTVLMNRFTSVIPLVLLTGIEVSLPKHKQGNQCAEDDCKQYEDYGLQSYDLDGRHCSVVAKTSRLWER